MVRAEEMSAPDGSAWLEFYACPDGHKLALYWALTPKPTDEQVSFVEREIARRGSFFPNSYDKLGRFHR